jgi:gas vesicle protein
VNRIISFLSGALMGALVGSTLAILLAPVSGNELRLKMTEQAKKIQHEVKEASQNRRIELENQLENLRKPQSSS